jgi:hypothetical protein
MPFLGRNFPPLGFTTLEPVKNVLGMKDLRQTRTHIFAGRTKHFESEKSCQTRLHKLWPTNPFDHCVENSTLAKKRK